MSAPPSAVRRLVLVFLAVVVAATWFTWLRPAALGGGVSYVVVQGESMAPTYANGDLVVVREEDSYGDGDVIAFRAGGTFDDPTRIIHRIVGDAGDGAFLTQGDNRDRLDPWQPKVDDVIGRAVLHVPMAGGIAGSLARPEALAALGGGAVLVGGQRRRRRKRRMKDRPIGANPDDLVPVRSARQGPATGAPRWARRTGPPWASVGLAVSVVLALPVLALTWSALRAPDTTVRVERVGAVDYGVEVDYRFSGEPSAVYPTGEVATVRGAAGALEPTGPLYSRLLDRALVTLAFRAVEEGADRMRTTYGYGVVVEGSAGWSSELASQALAPFDGTAVESVEIDLLAVAAEVAGVGELTGVGGDAYTVTVTPLLEVEAEGGGVEVRERLAPPLSFAVEGNLITPQAVGDVGGTEELSREVREEATYAVGPLEVGTQVARGLLGGFALVLVAATAWFASVVFGGLGLREPDRIAARYRSQIVDVAAAAAPPGPVVLVSAIDELARIAKLEQSVILHEDLGDGAHRYRVFLGAVTYEYEAAPEHAGAAAGDTGSTTDAGG